jgi:hypothetical protein
LKTSALRAGTPGEVYAHFGLALYMAQVLEHGIVNLATWTRIHDKSITTFEESEADSAMLFRQTMGSLKMTLLVRRSDIAHLQDLLDRAVELRNFLAHRYFRQRSAALATEDGRNHMIEELSAAHDFFKQVDDELEPLTMQILSALGVDMHMPEVMAEFRQAGFGDPLPGI